MTQDEAIKGFQTDLEKFAKLLDLAPSIVVKRIVFDAHGRISKRTPVDTGRARASWDVKQGTPSDFVPPITVGSVRKKGKTDLGSGLGENALGKGAANGGEIKDVATEISAIDGKQEVYVTTALDYMQYLEKGSSKQAPAGMVRISIAEIEVEIESIIHQLTS